LEPWNLGTLQPCTPGTLLGSWNPGTLEPLEPWKPWNPETVGPWYPGTLEPWNPETLESRNPGTLELWNPGTLKPWNPATVPPILKTPPGVCYLGGWVKGRLFSNRGKGLNRFLFLISKSTTIIFK